MAYEYRRMTPEQRTAAVRARREAGYPHHSPPHPYRGSGCFCITAANYEHESVMSPPARLTSFEDRLLSELTDVGVEVSAWVILTNHYHFLVLVHSLDQISATLQHLHGSTSREWNLEDGLTNQRKVWYRFRDRCIRSEAQYYHALNYIHYNPVKHGYVDSPYDWPWSSVHRYADTLGRAWLRQQWLAQPARKGWHYGDDEVAVEGIENSPGLP